MIMDFAFGKILLGELEMLCIFKYTFDKIEVIKW